MEYNTLGWKETMDDPDMGMWSYTYDKNGNLLKQTDAKDKDITFEYDELNRVELKNYTDPACTDTTYAYDQSFSGRNPIGRLTTMTDSTGNTKYYYDELGRTKKTEKTVGTNSYTTETTYDALSRTVDVTYPDYQKVNYTYGTGGNIKKVEDIANSIIYANYTGYNALEQVGDILYDNGVGTAYTYDLNNYRLKTIKTGDDLVDHTYSFDDIGNIENITDNDNGANSQTFTYDDLDRLKTANSGNYGSLIYAYDKIGNFTSKREINYTYSARPHAVTSTSDGNTYVYDANGNMTLGAGKSITYNCDNKPSSITMGGNTTIFFYDGSGARVKKMTGSSTTVYIGKLYEETGGVSTNYIFAGSTRIASKTTAGTHYYHQDHLGSSSVITDSSGVKSRRDTLLPVRRDSVRHKPNHHKAQIHLPGA